MERDNSAHRLICVNTKNKKKQNMDNRVGTGTLTIFDKTYNKIEKNRRFTKNTNKQIL